VAGNLQARQHEEAYMLELPPVST